MGRPAIEHILQHWEAGSPPTEFTLPGTFSQLELQTAVTQNFPALSLDWESGCQSQTQETLPASAHPTVPFVLPFPSIQTSVVVLAAHLPGVTVARCLAHMCPSPVSLSPAPDTLGSKAPDQLRYQDGEQTIQTLPGGFSI